MRCNTTAAFSIGMPRRFIDDSMIRMLAWWGTTQVDVIGAHAGSFHRGQSRSFHHLDSLAEDLAALHHKGVADLGIQDVTQVAFAVEIPPK